MSQIADLTSPIEQELFPDGGRVRWTRSGRTVTGRSTGGALCWSQRVRLRAGNPSAPATRFMEAPWATCVRVAAATAARPAGDRQRYANVICHA